MTLASVGKDNLKKLKTHPAGKKEKGCNCFEKWFGYFSKCLAKLSYEPAIILLSSHTRHLKTKVHEKQMSIHVHECS